MGVQVRSGGKDATFVAYSSVAGMAYVNNAEAVIAFDAAKAAIGEAEWKKGFGDKAKTASIRKVLKDHGVQEVNVSGQLTNAKIRVQTGDKGTFKFLDVTLRDGDERAIVSLNEGSAMARSVINKLVNAKIGENTTLSMFATYNKSDADGKFYANHGASVKQAEHEVPVSIDRKTEIVPLIDAKKAALKSAGIVDDKTVRAAVDNVLSGFYDGVYAKVAANFVQHYEQNTNAKGAAQAADAGEPYDAEDFDMGAA